MNPAAINAVSQVSGRSFTSFSEATAHVLEMLEAQLPDSVVFVAHLNGEEGELTIIDARGDDSFGLEAGASSSLDESFCMRMASDQGPRLSNHVPAEPAYRDLPASKALDIGSYLGVPLELGDGSRVGSLCAVSHSEGNYSTDDLQLISVMGRMLAYELERQDRERDLERMSEQLRELSQTDPLTEVLNRRGFEKLLAREWTLAQRGTVSSELVVIDIDDFKTVNDVRGHAYGDQVLQRVATTLKECARSTDVVSRLGGDEFAVILVGAEPEDGFAAFCDRVEGSLASTDDGPRLSYGWSDLTRAATPEAAVDDADKQMYAGRRARRHRRAPSSS